MRRHPTRLGSVILLSTACILIGASAERASAQDGREESQVFVSPLEGEQEVPARDTHARGVAVYTLDRDETKVTFRLTVANIAGSTP